MTVDDYVAERGQGQSRAAYVADLVPPVGVPVSLLMVFESPHVDEVSAGVPLMGAAGRSGLEYLLGARTQGSLGSFVAAKQATGDYRVAVMNVSNVPLQLAAFTTIPAPALAQADWDVLRRVRTSTARNVGGTRNPDANRIGTALLASLQTRFNAMKAGGDLTVVAAGRCAQRFVRQLTGLPSKQLYVAHPSYAQWLRDPDRAEHAQLRQLFTQHTS